MTAPLCWCLKIPAVQFSKRDSTTYLSFKYERKTEKKLCTLFYWSRLASTPYCTTGDNHGLICVLLQKQLHLRTYYFSADIISNMLLAVQRRWDKSCNMTCKVYTHPFKVQLFMFYTMDVRPVVAMRGYSFPRVLQGYSC